MRPFKSNCRSGSVMLEFVLTAVPILFVVISLIAISTGMWQYHTMTEAVNVTARAAAVHGAGCVGQTCATTVDTIARLLGARAIGIGADKLNVTLTSSASTVSCNPLNTCYGNSSAWPSLAGNTAATDITVKATLPISLPVSMWSPGEGSEGFTGITIGANARQAVVY
jgi:Flp pilus assembly protein TadG